jgi:hypothetical protein
MLPNLDKFFITDGSNSKQGGRAGCRAAAPASIAMPSGISQTVTMILWSEPSGFIE